MKRNRSWTKRTGQPETRLFHVPPDQGKSTHLNLHPMKTTPYRYPLGRRILAAFAVAILALPASWSAIGAPVSAPPGRTQRLASPETVPEGLNASDWTNIRQLYEQHHHAAVPVAGGHQARKLPGEELF